jgi:DNA-directed RNA polymerase specialized sigma24 family protein
MQPASDEALIGRIAAGDRRAMQLLFARHHVRVYRFVLRLVRDEGLAEDLISEVFLDVWRQAGRFEGRSAVGTWLLAISGTRRSRRCASGRSSTPSRRWRRKRRSDHSHRSGPGVRRDSALALRCEAPQRLTIERASLRI